MQSDELTKSSTCRTDPGANTASDDEERKVLTSVERSTVKVESQSCKWTTRFLHNTGDEDAKVTFLMMLDNSSGSMVATAVQSRRDSTSLWNVSC